MDHPSAPVTESIASSEIPSQARGTIAPNEAFKSITSLRDSLVNPTQFSTATAICGDAQPKRLTKNSPNAQTEKPNSVKGLHSFGVPDDTQTVAVTLDEALQAERDILPLLVRAAVHSIDRDLIERGIAAGWVPSHNIMADGEPNDIGIGWLRFRAACARAERTLYAQDDPMRRYLTHRAADSDAEANARARSMETMGRRRVA